MAMRTIAPFLAYEADAGGTGVPLLAKGTPGQILVAAADTTQTSLVATAYRLTDGTEFVPAANNHGAVEGFRVELPDEAPGIWFVSGPVASYQPTVEGSRGERGLPGTNGVETDEAMGVYMSTPGTNTNAETKVLVNKVLDTGLDERAATLATGSGRFPAALKEALDPFYAPRADRLSWADFTGGAAVHRLGGYQMPQATLAAARGALSAGCKVLDVDVRITADNVPVLAHDTIATVPPLTEWHDITSENVKAFQWDAAATVGGNWTKQPVATLEELLDEFGGKILILLEPKNQTILSWWQRSINAIAPLIKARRLEKSVMISMNAEFMPTHAQVVKDAGLLLHPYLTGDTVDRDDPTAPARYVASGANAVLLHGAVTSAVRNAWVATGVPVFGSPGNRRTNWATLQAAGVTGMIDDYAIYVAGLKPPVKKDPWRFGLWGAGDVPYSPTNRPKLVSDGLVFDKPESAYQTMLAGDFGPLPPTFILDLEVTHVTEAAGSWFGVQVCSQDDTAWNNKANTTGYTCFLWRSGGARVAEYVNGSSVFLASTASPAITPGTTFYLRVEVTASTVTCSQRDAAGNLMGTAASVTDSRWRGGYLHIGTNMPNAGSYKVKKLTIT